MSLLDVLRRHDVAPSRSRAFGAVAANGLLLSVCGVLVFGCSFALDADRMQCESDADCEARGPEFSGSVCDTGRSICVLPQSMSGLDAADGAPGSSDPRWACMAEPPVSAPAGSSFQVTLRAQDLVSSMPVPNAPALLCRTLDVHCETPVTAAGVTNAAGEVTFQVPANFSGYVRFDHPDYMSGLYHFNPPVREDRAATAVQLASPGVASALVGAVDSELTRLETHGLILLTTRDCEDMTVEGVRYSTDQAAEDAIGFYVRGSAPQRAQTDSLTDSTGYGGYINAKPGYAEIGATLAETNLLIGQLTVLVRANSISYTTMVPEYDP